MRIRAIFGSLAVALVACSAFAQGITLPPNGDNQRASVTQGIGLVNVTIDYNSPDVHSPTGEDRRGKIWGTDVAHYGFRDEAFGTCTECPWRAGANENTVFTVSHDVKVEGQPLKAGRYGLHMAVGPEEWTVIFSNNSTSWGSFTYDPKEDALRVKVKPQKSEYHEWLTYEFTDRQPAKATAALKWEDIQVPFTITVDNMPELYLAQIRNELRTSNGFDFRNYVAAARYALDNKHPKDGLEFAQQSVTSPFIGQEHWTSLSILAEAQEVNGMVAEAKVNREKALAHPTASAIAIHQYARGLLQKGDKEGALKAFELNAKRYPNAWPVNVGLARGYSAVGRLKDALKYAKLAAAQAPDPLNKKAMEDAVKKLEEGKPI